MKKRFVCLLLCVLLLAGLFPAGLSRFTASAEEEKLYKTEDVTVPKGWDYFEVSNTEELHTAFNANAWWRNDFHPNSQFIRLTKDIKVSSSEVSKSGLALIYLTCYSSTTLDLNGHKIVGEIREYDNIANKCWSCLNIQLRYGAQENFTFRIVDSVGGGGVSLNARTFLDGPTSAVNISASPLYWWVNEGDRENVKYPKAYPTVQIDGGAYKLTTEAREWYNGWMHIFRDPTDSNGNRLVVYTPWARSAMSVQGRCKSLTVNDGSFYARNVILDDNISTSYANRYASAFGVDEYSAEVLRVNGGDFVGNGCYAIYRYTEIQDGDLEYDTYKTYPKFNGGSFKGGVMLCSTRMTWWKKAWGEWELDKTCCDAPVGLMVPKNAVMTVDGKVTDASKMTLGDFGWPHEIVIEPAGEVESIRPKQRSWLTGQTALAFLTLNKTPESVEVLRRVVTIRQGEEYVIWQKVEGADWHPINEKGTECRIEIPSPEKGREETFKVSVGFNGYTEVSDPITLEWVDVPDYAFTKQPVSRTSWPGHGIYVPFDYNFPGRVYSTNLYRLIDGERWAVSFNGDFYDMGEDLGYAVAFTGPETSGAESETYCIVLEYYTDAGSQKVTVWSDEFTITWDNRQYFDWFPLDGWLRAGEPLKDALTAPDGMKITYQKWYRNGSPVSEETPAGPGKYHALLGLEADEGRAFSSGSVAQVFDEDVFPDSVSDNGKIAFFTTPAVSVSCDHAGNTDTALYQNVGEHWNVCSVCGQRCNVTGHDFETAVSGSTVIHTCTACGYRKTTDNGKECVDWLWLDTAPLAVGAPLPPVDIDPLYASKASLTAFVWYEGTTPKTPGDTVESGKTYRLVVNAKAADYCYFPDDISLRGRDGVTNEVQISSSAYLAATLTFTPVATTAADVALPALTPGKTMGEVLEEIGQSAFEDAEALYGIEVKLTAGGAENSYYKNIYTDGWKNYSASVPIDTFKTQTVQPGTQYILEITLLVNAEKRYVPASEIYVKDAWLADSVVVTGDSKQMARVLAVITTEGDGKTVDFIKLRVDEPVPGQTPASSAEGLGFYKAETVSWAGKMNGGKFACETAYTVILTVSATNGAAFASDALAAVNGVTASVKTQGDERIVTYTFPATKHEYGPWAVTKAPTATEEGIESRICAGCGATQVRPLPKTEAAFMLGDVDADEMITAADARLALRKAVELETFGPESREFRAADVDKDSQVTAADARKILRAAVDLEDPKTW